MLVVRTRIEFVVVLLLVDDSRKDHENYELS